MLNDRDKILSALREKPQKVFEVMKRANISNQEACQSLLLKMRDEGSVKFDIHKGQWLIAWLHLCSKRSRMSQRVAQMRARWPAPRNPGFFIPFLRIPHIAALLGMPDEFWRLRAQANFSNHFNLICPVQSSREK
jgi:hypothetical protein